LHQDLFDAVFLRRPARADRTFVQLQEQQITSSRIAAAEACRPQSWKVAPCAPPPACSAGWFPHAPLWQFAHKLVRY